MRTPSLALATLVAISGIAAADPDSITLHRPTNKAGDKWTEDKTESSVLTVEIKGNKVPVTSDHHDKKSIEVSKVTDGVVTEAKYTYVTFAETEKVNGADATKPSPSIAGKTYKLTAGSPIGVAASSGAASDDEVALVRKLEHRFGKPDGMGNVLDGKTFARGKPVALPADQIKDALGGDGMTGAGMTLTYRGLDGANASFDVAMKMEGDKNGFHLVAELTGKVLVDPKTWVLISLDAKGSFKGTGKGTLDGTLTISEHTTR